MNYVTHRGCGEVCNDNITNLPNVFINEV